MFAFHQSSVSADAPVQQKGITLPTYPLSESPDTPPLQVVPHPVLTPQQVLQPTVADAFSIHPTALVDVTAKIAAGVVIEAYCVVGANVEIGANTHLLPHTVITHNTVVGQESLLGPFLHIREGVKIGNHCKVGNFVELKNATIADSSCVSHLSYIGDATLGEWVNIGAGTITANFNSLTGEKHRTVIEDFVSIGANSVLVAPVSVEHRAMVAAGSVITKNVAPYSLGIARGKQTEVTDWVKAQLKRLSS